MTDADPHQLVSDHLPTPFTAADLRAACPPGRTLRYRLVRPGKEPVIRVTRYASTDADGAEQESWDESPAGIRLTELEREHETWLELQAHASFPTATTQRNEETIDVPAGRYDCWRYIRVDENGTWRFWFARELPGQPIRFDQQIDGVTVFSATLEKNVIDADG